MRAFQVRGLCITGSDPDTNVDPIGFYRVLLGVIWGIYRDNGKEHGNYYLGFRV